MPASKTGSKANLALNVALAVGVAAALAGGIALLFADSRSADGVVVIATPERALSVSETPTPSAIAVYVTGEVENPGVYDLPSDSRARDALDAAGGAAPDADLERVNLAKRLSDGEHIRVPERGASPAPGADAATPRQPRPAPPPPAENAQAPADYAGKIDVNAADAAALESLPGIGPSRARAIIEHRQANGPFASVDDLTEVRGIGEGILESIRDLVEAR